jgi:hypothetical protein
MKQETRNSTLSSDERQGKERVLLLEYSRAVSVMRVEYGTVETQTGDMATHRATSRYNIKYILILYMLRCRSSVYSLYVTTSRRHNSSYKLEVVRRARCWVHAPPQPRAPPHPPTRMPQPRSNHGSNAAPVAVHNGVRYYRYAFDYFYYCSTYFSFLFTRVRGTR